MTAISIVMPVYNCGPYIREAIDSMLGQRFKDFEFIIINDGSTDETEAIIKSYADTRIKYLNNETNLGVSASRNLGMGIATGKYIAVMDGDDIAFPERLQEQFNFLEKHPDTDILGTAREIFSDSYRFIKTYPFDPGYIASHLFFRNALAQPTVMLRREFIVANGLWYNTEINIGEDFDLWYRAVMAGGTIKNLTKPLLYYRVSDTQASHISNNSIRLSVLESLFRSKLEQMRLKCNDGDFDLLFSFVMGRIKMDHEKYRKLKSMFDEIEKANSGIKSFSTTYFSAVILSFRIRLIKYLYLEQGKPIVFLFQAVLLLLQKGPTVFWLFWVNEGRYIKKLPGELP